jgi:glycosyltransferase involved in cell wall biosynthesis
MRILYLHQFFITRAGGGGTRSYEFARRFVERGHGVRMVTAGDGTRTVDGIEVVGVRGAYTDYMQATALSNTRRMLAFGRFALGATLAALRGPRPDVIYASSPPLTMALPALVAAARWRAPLVFEVRDLWPEAPIQMGALRNPLLRAAARGLERLAYRRAAAIVALSPGIRTGVLAAGAAADKVEIVPNGADLELFAPAANGGALRDELGLSGRFVCSYFGAMGEANDLTQVIEAAALLRERNVSFVLLGGGKRRADLERLARERGAANVLFMDPVPDKASVARLAAASDACLTIFKDVPVLATNSPNKLFDTFAAGRAAIVNADGWMRELVERNDAGVYVRAGDPVDLAEKIGWLEDDRELTARLGRNARALAEREFDRDALAGRVLALLERTASPARPVP